MAVAFDRISARAWSGAAALALGTATAALAQQADQSAETPPVNSTSTLKLPDNPQVFGPAMPSVVKATAIINGDVVTQTN